MKKYPSASDIAEMKARGYDRVTIADAEERSKRGPEAEQLCRRIEAAFSGVKLGNGVGLKETRGLDDYADAATCAAYREEDEKEDWRRIPVEAINVAGGGPSFFDAEGMRFHLPVYLIAELRGDYGRDIAFHLTSHSDHARCQFNLLNKEQRQVVRAFLLFIADDDGYQLDLQNLRHALGNYWAESD